MPPAPRYQPADPVGTYRYIAQPPPQLPVRQLCQTLRVSASAYYAWQRRQPPTSELA